MDPCAEAISLFCREQGVILEQPAKPVVRLELPGTGVLQFERHAGKLTLLLNFAVAQGLLDRAILSALRCVCSDRAALLPVRCGLLGNGQLVLLVSLDERRVSGQVLDEAYRLLCQLRLEVLAA